MTTFDETSDGREISLTNGEEFRINLAENPTTGFRWRLLVDGSPAIACVVDEFQPPGHAQPGQAGLHVWNFRCAAEGDAEIQLVNTRAGATNETSGRKFTLRVRSRPNE